MYGFSPYSIAMIYVSRYINGNTMALSVICNCLCGASVLTVSCTSFFSCWNSISPGVFAKAGLIVLSFILNWTKWMRLSTEGYDGGVPKMKPNSRRAWKSSYEGTGLHKNRSGGGDYSNSLRLCVNQYLPQGIVEIKCQNWFYKGRLV